MRTTAAPTMEPATAARAHLPYIAVGLVGLLVSGIAAWGNALDRIGQGISLHAAPLFGAWQPRTGVALLGPLVIAGLVVWKGTYVAERLAWTRLLIAVSVTACAWAVALALVDPEGMVGLTRGVSSPQDFLASVDRIDAPGPFLDTFTERIDDYVVHVRGHPPGLIVVLWWMRRIGLGGAAPVTVLLIAAGAAAIVAALAALRGVVDERTARRAAPFLVVSPAAIWLATSADALYAAVGAIGVAALTLASSRVGPRSDGLAAAGGFVFALGLFLSYGLVPLLVIPFVVSLARRRLRPMVVAGAAMVCVGIVFAAFGFSWIDGLWATRREYAMSVAGIRPYEYFVFANLAALAIVLGPAPIAGATVVRDRRLRLLVGTILVAVAAADLSGLSKGEVERIWLPFWPWIATAAAALVTRTRWWLAAQAALAIGVQSLIGTPW